MKSKRCLYGLTGLLSLLGLIGVFTEDEVLSGLLCLCRRF